MTVMILNWCSTCGTNLDPMRDFDNHACKPPVCRCWKPGLSDHEPGCPVAHHEAAQARFWRTLSAP